MTKPIQARHVTEDLGIYRGDLMCCVRSLHYDFARRVGALVLGPHSCTDQTGAVSLFARIDPMVRRVETVGDPDDYQRDSDVFGRFLDEACEASEGAEVGAADLFKHYETWAERQGYGPRERLSRTAFGRKASERLRRVDLRAGRVYQGIARRSPVEGL